MDDLIWVWHPAFSPPCQDKNLQKATKTLQKLKISQLLPENLLVASLYNSKVCRTFEKCKGRYHHTPSGKGQRQAERLWSYPNEWLSEGASKRQTSPSLQNSSLAPPPPGRPPLPSFSGLGPASVSLPTWTSGRALPLHVTLYLSPGVCDIPGNPCIYTSVSPAQ